MKTQELVERYNIAPGYGKNAGNIIVRNMDTVKADGMAKVKAELTARKPEILAYFQEQERARQEAREQREAKIAAIPGLTEIKDARAAWYDWRRRLNASFEGEGAVGGLGVGPAPENPDNLLSKYPIAATYLRAEEYAEKENFELSDIGTKARERIINDPADYAAAMDEMDAAIHAFTEKHMWD